MKEFSMFKSLTLKTKPDCMIKPNHKPSLCSYRWPIYSSLDFLFGQQTNDFPLSPIKYMNKISDIFIDL